MTDAWHWPFVAGYWQHLSTVIAGALMLVFAVWWYGWNSLESEFSVPGSLQ